MLFGVVFPQTEIGADPTGVRDYTQAAEALGYNHLLAYEHVIGADTSNRPNWTGPYTVDTLFHEPFILFGYLAGLTTRLSFVTGVVILPQRQTVLVAKQSIEVDVLSQGRFRLGIGVGWNPVEYEALNEDFHNRGKRGEEQILLLRKLFTEQVVTYHGRWHHVEAAGLNPLPVQRPIPIWIGGSSDATLRRVAKMGDGWFPQMTPNEQARDMMRELGEYAQEEGRDPDSIGIEARLSIAGKREDEWIREVKGWQDLGAGYIGVNTMKAGLSSPQAHIDAISHVKDVLASANLW